MLPAPTSAILLRAISLDSPIEVSDHRRTLPRPRSEDGVRCGSAGFLARFSSRSKAPAARERPVTVTFMSYAPRSEEHTSELQSLMRISYAVFCLQNKKTKHK